ncbi:MAG TPA: glycosyltransferase family 4 protein [Acetobacteraceae bacterium]|jgi:glycosyltransferase involved in cell wall biosynthesis|nr:glycosyltransferase family 4 protein [Acetobacteraceae bacterium]
MKIGLVSSAVPLVFGGGRFIVDWLREKLEERGHAVETVFIPTVDTPEILIQQMAAFRLMRLENHFERVITFRPPAHVVRHPCKVVWFIHHVRYLYDLWDSEHRPFADLAPHRALRDTVVRADTAALKEARHLFTNSRVVSDRVRRFNGLESEVLYPPVLRPELFAAGEYGNEIVSVCRVERHKRQHLLIEAMRHVRTPVRLRLCGTGLDTNYMQSLRRLAEESGAADRIAIEDAWITEEEKAARLEGALASAYVPYDEDSYGYPTIEAAHARRCTVTVSDAGGVAEFVRHGETGLTAAPQPVELAAAFDRLHADRALARRLGDNAAVRVAELGIDWDTVIEKLLA